MMPPHFRPDPLPGLGEVRGLATLLAIAFSAAVGYLYGVWTGRQWRRAKDYDRGHADGVAARYRPTASDALHVTKQEGQ